MNLFTDTYPEIFPFPDRNIPPEQKTSRKYTKAVGSAIYSRYLKDSTAMSSSSRSMFQYLRAYGVGQQPEEKYKRYLSGVKKDSSTGAITDADGSWTQNKTEERGGWMNVLWDILSPAQMIRDMIHGLFDDIDFDIIADAVDADSGAAEENDKWKLWVNTKSFIAQRLLAARAMAGVPVERPDFVPENVEELEMFKEAGGFKMVYAMEMEKLLRHTSDISEWMDLKAKIIDDIIDLNRAFTKGDYDSHTKKIKWRYADAEFMVMQYSKYHDYRDSEYGGEFKDMKISDLREQMLNEGYTEKEIKQVAEKYVGVYGNPSKDGWDKYNKQSGSWGYDNFTVVAFDFEWIDSDVEKKIKYTNKYGKVRMLPYTEGQDLGKREKLNKTTARFLYKGTWIVGTDYAFDYGKSFYQPRPRPNEIELTYKGFSIPGQPLTARLIPIYDNIQIGWVKYQNSMAQQFESGYTVDWRMLQNISDGDKKFSPSAILKMWKETGILLFMSRAIGQSYTGGASAPVHRLEGGMGNTLTEAMGRIQLQFTLIEKMTGFSPMALGATPDPDAPVTTSERSLQATHSSMKPMIRGLFNLKNQLAKSASPRIQQMLKYDPESTAEYEKVIGMGGIEAIRTAQSTAAEYGIRLQARPTLQEKTALLRAAEISLQPGRDGNPGISYDDYTYIVERLHAGGNIKEIRLYLNQARKRMEKKSFQEKQQLIKQQADNALQISQDGMKRAAMEENMKTQGQIAVDNNKGAIDLRLKMMEINGDYMNQLEKQMEKENVS